MNNNNIYSSNEKKPLSQSKIFTDKSHLRLPSASMQQRNSSSEMYNSSIFMKSSGLMNQQSQSLFFQSRQPLSPHYANKSSVNNNIQYIPQYSSNIISMRQPDSNYYPIPLSKDLIMERALSELKEKMDSLEKRLEIQDNVVNSDRLKQLIVSICDQRIQTFVKPIWQRVNQLDSSTLHPSYNQKLIQLQQSFLRLQSQKLHEQQLTNRIKTIEKTIREMGEDIHLVNDKEESLGAKIETELPWLRNQLKTVKVWEKKWKEIEGTNEQVKEIMQQLGKRVKALQGSLTQPNIMTKLKQLQSRIQSIPTTTIQPQISRSFEKYPSSPIILKYIQRFRILSQQNQSQYQQFEINQMTYYIDEQGYLLDANSFYLVNASKGDRVRLVEGHLELLKNNNILH